MKYAKEPENTNLKNQNKERHNPQDKRKSTIPPERKAPDTDEEGIGVVHRPQ